MNDKLPLVSVCVPNYNYGHYLRNCFESILAQTYPNIEVIFNDNKSIDDSFEIAMEYYRIFKEKGIYMSIHNNKENCGSDKNTNQCLARSRGEFSYVLASDDSIEPTFIERCITVFNKYPNVAFVMTHRNEVDENGNVKKTPPFYNQNCIIKGEDQAAVFMMAGIAIPGQRMSRNSVTGPIMPYKRTFNVAGDWYENFLMAMCGDVAYIAEPLCNYRVHSGNETNESEKNLMGIFEHYQLINSFVEISKNFGMTKPVARYTEAVEKLGSMCLRYAFKMFQNNLNDTALRYLLLAPVLKRNIVEDETYKKLLKCVDLRGSELSESLKKLQSGASLERTKSYDPPEGYEPLMI